MSNFVLKDLNKLTSDCREAYKNLPDKTDIFLNEDLIKKLKPVLDHELKADIQISSYSFEYTNKKGQFAILPSKWLWVALEFHPLKEAFDSYSEILNELKKMSKFKDDTFLKDYPMTLEPKTKTTEQIDFENEALLILKAKDPQSASTNFTYFKKFIYERAWWNLGNVPTKAEKASGKAFDRATTDLFKSTLLTATQFIVSNSDKLSEVIYAVSADKSIISDLRAIKSSIKTGTSLPPSISLSPKIKSESTTPYTDPGENVIYFGAPGTGKSNAINDLVTENNSIRTVFHAETYYSDFVGCLKPTMGSTGIEYGFQIGPFTEMLIKALNDPSHHYYLVIEEINRAKSAAVFGEIFQLLDRDNGESKYSIKINDQDLIKAFEQNLKTPLSDNLIKIPKNLSILATMNTSDQAVEPMDTAFKRRWKYVYMPIDFDSVHKDTGKPLHTQGNFEIIRNDEDDNKEIVNVSWKDLALKLNDFLSDLDVPEDRHFGPWFVKDDEILDLDKAKDTLGSKILMYLWDDVLRHEGKSELFTNEIKTYGQLISKLNNDEVIFNANFSNLFK